MSFLAPKWNVSEQHYIIETTNEFKEVLDTHLPIIKDCRANTVFDDMDRVYNVTDVIVEKLIDEGSKNKWFAKLPSHEQLMKRVRHTFSRLSFDGDTASGILTVILMTPKQLTFIWTPTEIPSGAPPLYIDESDSESDAKTEGDIEPEIQESNLPPVALVNESQISKEEYLLTRLRAAKARVEAEQIRMMYFETTGRMPPDSDSESEDE